MPILPATPPPEPRPRLRDLGIGLGTLPPGQYNAITDVPGVQVGHVTLLASLDGRPVRTGVTVIRPHGENEYLERVTAAVETINGFGKAVGFEQVRELGLLETPIALTNTLSVPAAAEGLLRWTLAHNPAATTINPVVAECNDSRLNDIAGLHVRPEHVEQALAAARAGPVAEGTVGAGTGMVGFGFKGGIGTASRVVTVQDSRFTVGALVLLNCGQRADLVVAQVPVGRWLASPQPKPTQAGEAGSVIVVLATDAPVTARQLDRLARRAVIGLAHTGAMLDHQSGDFVIAFSTAQRWPRADQRPLIPLLCINEALLANLFFRAVIESTEEAVLNALFTARGVPGAGGEAFPELPAEAVLNAVAKESMSHVR
jgi:D-aminopeptidase